MDELKYYCGICGTKVPNKPMSCEECSTKRSMFHNAKCGVCGKYADRFYVYGLRCSEHYDIYNPSSMVYQDSNVVVTII